MAELRTQLGSEDDEDEPEYLQYKIILLGDGAVGKTSLATRFCEDHFAKSYKQTIGLDFFVKRLVLPRDVHVCMQIWDIGGQSIGGKMSFQHLEDWHFLVKRTFGSDPLPYMALLANKQDLAHIRTVKSDKHTQFANENDLYSYMVSARTGEQVHPTFFRIAADLAGVALTKPEIEVTQKPTKAEVVNHERHDPAYDEATAADLGKGKKCCIM